MEQKMKELGSDDIVSEVYVPIPASSSEYILGPCFRDEFPSELEPFYPLAIGEKLLLQTLQPGWQKSKTWKSWPNLTKGWIDWVDRLEKVKGENWRNAGIYDAIQLSRIDIPRDSDLLYAALCFWSISSNSFHFNFGMMGPTVLDIVALTGLRPHGEEISSTINIPKSTYSFPKGENDKKLYYEEFLKVNMKSEEATEDEHVAFLTMWLCKYIFGNGSLRPTKEYSQLAVVLASGRKLAMAPFVLSHLYRGCRNLVTNEFGAAGGPFWILQLWLQSYFLEYGPLLNHDSQNFPTYGVLLAQGKLKKKSFGEYFKFFYSCSSRTPDQFTPLSSELVKCLRLWLHHTSYKQELSDIWSSYLIARDLHYGLLLGKSLVGKAGVEYYSPNQFARQFGMTQTVPLPPYQSVNTSSLDRTVFKSINCIEEVDLKFVQLKSKFSVVHFDANPKCTSSFESWWSTYIRKTRTESAEEILDRIDGEATKKRRNEDSISEQQKFEGQEKDERPSIKAKREMCPPGFEDIIPNNMPKSVGGHGSSHSCGDTVNCHEKSVANVVVLDDTSSDEDATPLGTDIKSRAPKMSQYSAQVLDETKSEVQKLLMMPLHEVLLPENYSVLVASLPIYAGSPNLSVEKARTLEELGENLPSLFTNFQQAKRQKDEYYSKAAKKVILVDKLTKKQERYNDLQQHHIETDASIASLKASLEKAEKNKRAIEEQEIHLKNEISPLEAALEELGTEFLDSKKEMADSLTTQTEASWADYKQKIIDSGM